MVNRRTMGRRPLTGASAGDLDSVFMRRTENTRRNPIRSLGSGLFSVGVLLALLNVSTVMSNPYGQYRFMELLLEPKTQPFGIHVPELVGTLIVWAPAVLIPVGVVLLVVGWVLGVARR